MCRARSSACWPKSDAGNRWTCPRRRRWNARPPEIVALGSPPGDGGSHVAAHEVTLLELLLGEPEIVAWLEPDKHVEDDDEEEPTS
jgi:hypothetical protein